MGDSNRIWAGLPPDLTLPLDEVHIWRALLDIPDQSVHVLRRALSPDEVERANRFVFEKDRRRFIVARGLLRRILSRYLQVSPADVEFCYGARGKPELSTPSSLRFNLSHSGGVALFAVGHYRKLGVDIEQIRSNVAFLELAQSCFSPLECAMLRGVPAPQIPQAFFNCWTRKEAYVKATGEGLYLPLQSFDVSLLPSEAAILIEVRDSGQEASQWSMRELFAGAEFAAALVAEGSDWHPRFWQWPTDISL